MASLRWPSYSHETADHHDPYEKSHAPHNWWDWYAAYMTAREHGSTPDEASDAAGRYMERELDVGVGNYRLGREKRTTEWRLAGGGRGNSRCGRAGRDRFPRPGPRASFRLAEDVAAAATAMRLCEASNNPINQEAPVTATTPTPREYVACANRVLRAANGISYAYREVGGGTPPLVLLQHFRGNLDNWIRL